MGAGHFAAGSGEADDTSADSFLGWGQWERSPTATSIQLARTHKGVFSLRFHKHRLANLGFSVLELERDSHGFFAPKHASEQMLLLWPGCLRPEERESVLSKVASQRDVFKEIAERTCTPFETVKSQFQRGREKGAVYDWLEVVK